MYSKLLRVELRKMIDSMPDVAPELHTDALLDIYAPLFPYMTRADVLYFRKLVMKKLPKTDLVTLIDGNLALRDILGEEEPKKKKK